MRKKVDLITMGSLSVGIQINISSDLLCPIILILPHRTLVILPCRTVKLRHIYHQYSRGPGVCSKMRHKYIVLIVNVFLSVGINSTNGVKCKFPNSFFNRLIIVFGKTDDDVHHTTLFLTGTYPVEMLWKLLRTLLSGMYTFFSDPALCKTSQHQWDKVEVVTGLCGAE